MEPVKERIYAFDTLRTVMVLLGIVIHAAMIYRTNIFNEPFFFNDPKNHSPIANGIADLIHIFRMPVFFSISGFFTALIYLERGQKKMITNRLQRLVYPFVVGLLFLLPMHIFSLNFFAVSVLHIENRYNMAFDAVKGIRTNEINTIHLWFLYYLIWYCVTSLLVAYAVNKWFPNLKTVFQNGFHSVFKLKSAPFIFTVPTFLCLYWMLSFDIDAVDSFCIDIKFFLLYGTFFFFGWLCYVIKSELNRFEKQSYAYLVFALALFAVRWKCLLLYHNPASDAITKVKLANGHDYPACLYDLVFRIWDYRFFL